MTEPGAGPRRPPSPPLYGAAITVLQLLAVAWLLLYAFAGLGWQQRLGAWNYLVALGVSVVSGQLLQFWRGDGRRAGSRPERRRQRRQRRAEQA